MDFVIIVGIVLAVGLCKVKEFKAEMVPEVITMKDDGTLVVPDSCIPIGENLSLKKDPNAFMDIVIEMGLKY